MTNTDQPQPGPRSLGQTGFGAYAEHTGHRTHDSRPMPAWDDLGEKIQGAWAAAARAIAAAAAATREDFVLHPAPQVPSIGRIVLVAMDPLKNNGADVAPAVVTRAWSGTSINVRVLADNQPADTEWRTSLTYVDDLDQVDRDDPARLYRWTWPPRT